MTRRLRAALLHAALLLLPAVTGYAALGLRELGGDGRARRTLSLDVRICPCPLDVLPETPRGPLVPSRGGHTRLDKSGDAQRASCVLPSRDEMT